MHGERWRTRAVLLAAVVDDDELVEAIRLGVRGIVLKEMAPQFLVECLRPVHAGRQWFEQRVVGDCDGQARPAGGRGRGDEQVTEPPRG
jgi:DNA-binding NarL/FixJ family response regulator